MKSSRTYPQKHDGHRLYRHSEVPQEGCCAGCCSKRAVCVSVLVLVALAITVTAVAVGLVFGLQNQPPDIRDCQTLQNKSGFLCDDGVTCVPPSFLCNGVHDCPSGGDESSQMCSDLPHNLPSNLVFHCGNSRFWIFVDKKCNNLNDCGDCSDEMGIYAECHCCGPQWWSCPPVDFQYCVCVPRSLCQDGRQHCYDWSDEHACAPD